MGNFRELITKKQKYLTFKEKRVIKKAWKQLEQLLPEIEHACSNFNEGNKNGIKIEINERISDSFVDGWELTAYKPTPSTNKQRHETLIITAKKGVVPVLPLTEEDLQKMGDFTAQLIDQFSIEVKRDDQTIPFKVGVAELNYIIRPNFNEV